jgi:ribosomal protein S27E
MFGKGPFGKALDVAAQVTGGVCPTCNNETVFVSLSPEIYRCMNCGTDCRQYINGSIKYLPTMSKSPQEIKDGENTKVGG